VQLAPGWKVTAARGAIVTGPQRVSAHLVQATDQAVWVQVAPDPSSGP
jgi:hypothetical protein